MTNLENETRTLEETKDLSEKKSKATVTPVKETLAKPKFDIAKVAFDESKSPSTPVVFNEYTAIGSTG